MRKILLIGAVLVLPMNAMAQTTTPALAEAVPTPRLETTVDGYRVAAIAAGAVAGVIVANVVTGGMITPVLLAGSGEAGMVAAMPAVVDASVLAVPEVASGAHFTTMVAQAAVTAAGALTGGYFGNWVYGE